LFRFLKEHVALCPILKVVSKYHVALCPILTVVSNDHVALCPILTVVSKNLVAQRQSLDFVSIKEYIQMIWNSYTSMVGPNQIHA
jgi:hypothetical protein